MLIDLRESVTMPQAKAEILAQKVDTQERKSYMKKLKTTSRDEPYQQVLPPPKSVPESSDGLLPMEKRKGIKNEFP